MMPWTLGALVKEGQDVGTRLEEATREFVNGTGALVKDDVLALIAQVASEVQADPPFIVYIRGDYSNPESPQFSYQVEGADQPAPN